MILAGWDEGYFAFAQSIPSLQQFDQSRQRVQPLERESVIPFNFRLQSPERSPIPRAIDSIKFTLGGIRIEGATVFLHSELASIYKSSIGQVVVLEDVRQIAEKIEAKYRQEGYFLTRVFLPPQQVQDGIFTIKVIEGYIGSIQIEGATEELRLGVYENLEHLLKQKPAQIIAVERALLILNDLPGIEGSGLLRAGRDVGATDLVVQLNPIQTSNYFNLNNQASRSVGPIVGSYNKQFRNVFYAFDELTLQLASSADRRELANLSWRYTKPVLINGLTISLGSLFSYARPGGDFQTLNLESKVITQSVRLRYPLIRSREGSLFVEAGATNVVSRTLKDSDALLQEKHTGKDITIQAIDLQSRFGTTQATLGYSKANSVNAPLPSVAGFDNELSKYNYSFKHRINSTSGLYGQMEVVGQSATKPLLSSERIAFGGGNIGKGFAPSSIVGDRGYGNSFEVGWSTHMTMPWDSAGQIQFFAFRDLARAEQISSDNSGNLIYKLRSSGLGLRWQSADGWRTSLYVANPQLSEDQKTLVKEKIYFNINIPW
jgi:hemolysin activation/secretion protein